MLTLHWIRHPESGHYLSHEPVEDLAKAFAYESPQTCEWDCGHPGGINLALGVATTGVGRRRDAERALLRIGIVPAGTVFVSPGSERNPYRGEM